jgi:hypothetical protein
MQHATNAKPLSHVTQVTGQEVMCVPGSGHVACTVEMASLGMHADVAVIDEIQVNNMS